MDAVGPPSTPAPPTRVPELAEPKHRFGKGALWAKVESLESSLRFLRGRLKDEAPEEVQRIDELLARLEQAKACITRTCGARHCSKDLSLFWMRVHEIAADVLLIIPADILAAEALTIESNFRRNIHEPVARATWLGADEKSGPLHQAVLYVTGFAQRETLKSDQGVTQARYILRSALRMVNKQADRYFRQLALNMLLRSLSGGLLLLAFALTYVFSLPRALTDFLQARTLEFPGVAVLAIILLGAGGSIVANMLSEQPVLDLNGPKWRQFAYQLFIKPSIGAFAAFLFYLLAQSQLLFRIEAPDSPPPPSPASVLARAQAVATPETPEVHPPVSIQLGSEKALICTYIILFIAVGFSAEKFLGPTMDKVLNKLFYTAEKSVRSPGTAPVSPPGTGGQVLGAVPSEARDA